MALPEPKKSEPQKISTQKNPAAGIAPPMSALEAIRKRRAVRCYKTARLSRDIIQSLLSAAVLAPTAMHEEPWAFAIVENPDVLKSLSDAAKESLDPDTRASLSRHFQDPDFNIFYNAPALIIICAEPGPDFVAADCWLAAENLMLAACAEGLGSCVIGLAVDIINTPAWKKRLGIPAKMAAYVPLIAGLPEGETPPVPRKPPEIISWL